MELTLSEPLYYVIDLTPDGGERTKISLDDAKRIVDERRAEGKYAAIRAIHSIDIDY